MYRAAAGRSFRTRPVSESGDLTRNRELRALGSGHVALEFELSSHSELRGWIRILNFKLKEAITPYGAPADISAGIRVFNLIDFYLAYRFDSGIGIQLCRAVVGGVSFEMEFRRRRFSPRRRLNDAGMMWKLFPEQIQLAGAESSPDREVCRRRRRPLKVSVLVFGLVPSRSSSSSSTSPSRRSRLENFGFEESMR